MNIIDYTGKLNNHQEYIDILDKIESKCKYIEIVIINWEDFSYEMEFNNIIQN